MKKFSLVLLLLIVFSVFSINASAATAEFDDYNLTVNLPDDYKYITVANASRQEETVNNFGYSVKSIKSYMNNNEIILIAINEQSLEQLQIKATETDFSKGITSLSGLSGNEKAEIAQLLFPTTEFTEKSYNGTSYFVTSGDGVISFSTIASGRLYTITYYGDNSASAEKITNGITLKSSEGITLSGGTNIVQIVVTSAVAIIALICSIAIIVTLVVDLKNRNKWKDEEETIIIKRRKR